MISHVGKSFCRSSNMTFIYINLHFFVIAIYGFIASLRRDQLLSSQSVIIQQVDKLSKVEHSDIRSKSTVKFSVFLKRLRHKQYILKTLPLTAVHGTIPHS